MNLNSSKTVKEENTLRLFVSKFFPYWPIFLILLTVTLTVTYAYLQMTTPVYLSSATILIQDEKKGAEDPKIVESFNFFSSKKIVENEIEVIHSRTLLTEVAKELSLTVPTFEKQQLKYLPADKYTSAYITSPIKIDVGTIIQKGEDKNGGKIPFTYIAAFKQVKVNNKLYPINQWVSTPYGSLRFSENNKKTKDARNPLYFSLIDINGEIESLSHQISVTPVSKLSTVVRLEIEDEVPERGNDILNALAEAYYMSSVTAKNAMAANTLRFVDNRISLVKSDLDALERKIQLYKAHEGIVDLSVQGKQFIENVGSNDQKIADINMQLAVLNQVEKYVVSKDNKAGIVPSTLGITDPVLTNLLQKLYESENEYEKLRRLTAENNPILLSLAGQIEKIRPDILENIKNQRQSLVAGKSNVGTTNGTYNTALSTMPQKEKALLELTRQQNIISNVYTFLLQKREETALSYSSNILDNRIIDVAASSTKPVKPNKLAYYFVSICLAIVLGLALIIGKELLNGKVLYRSEIEKLTAFPVVAEFAYDKEAKPLAISEGSRSLIAEQFRKLRASLYHMSIGGDVKKILVTSTISGEGKSFIAANLGLTLAFAGKKVILLELDLTNPSLSEKLDVHEEKGITSYLQGKSSSEDIIRSTNANKNLYIIPSGELPNNPSELIMNGKVEELLAYLELRFDYIIIDTAPVSALSDAYVLSPLCNSTLYVVRHNHTPKVGLQRLDLNNEINELKNVRIVFNSVKTRGFSKTDFGYGYNYGSSSVRQNKTKLIEG